MSREFIEAPHVTKEEKELILLLKNQYREATIHDLEKTLGKTPTSTEIETALNLFIKKLKEKNILKDILKDYLSQKINEEKNAFQGDGLARPLPSR